MPQGVYIICSESGAIDRRTNAISIFGVIDTIRFASVSEVSDAKNLPGVSKPWIDIRTTAVWRCEEDELGEAYEHQTTFSIPGDEHKRIVGEGSFVFKTPLHRFVIDFGGPVFNQAGVIRIENRIRKLGDDDWQEMAYEIRVEKISLSEKPST